VTETQSDIVLDSYPQVPGVHDTNVQSIDAITPEYLLSDSMPTCDDEPPIDCAETSLTQCPQTVMSFPNTQIHTNEIANQHHVMERIDTPPCEKAIQVSNYVGIIEQTHSHFNSHNAFQNCSDEKKANCSVFPQISNDNLSSSVIHGPTVAMHIGDKQENLCDETHNSGSEVAGKCKSHSEKCKSHSAAVKCFTGQRDPQSIYCDKPEVTTQQNHHPIVLNPIAACSPTISEVQGQTHMDEPKIIAQQSNETISFNSIALQAHSTPISAEQGWAHVDTPNTMLARVNDSKLPLAGQDKNDQHEVVNPQVNDTPIVSGSLTDPHPTVPGKLDVCAQTRSMAIKDQRDEAQAEQDEWYYGHLQELPLQNSNDITDFLLS
jgi:hypothetical protein